MFPLLLDPGQYLLTALIMHRWCCGTSEAKEVLCDFHLVLLRGAQLRAQLPHDTFMRKPRPSHVERPQLIPSASHKHSEPPGEDKPPFESSTEVQGVMEQRA